MRQGGRTLRRKRLRRRTVACPPSPAPAGGTRQTQELKETTATVGIVEGLRGGSPQAEHILASTPFLLVSYSNFSHAVRTVTFVSSRLAG